MERKLRGPSNRESLSRSRRRETAGPVVFWNAKRVGPVPPARGTFFDAKSSKHEGRMTMIDKAAIILFLSLVSTCLAVDETQEPPLKYKLEINGQPHELTLGQTKNLEGEYQNPRVTLSASPTRQFTYGNVSFQYPAYYVWKAQVEGPSEKRWVLSGKDYKFMYMTIPYSITNKQFALGVSEQFGKNLLRLMKQSVS
ncbi:MAG: hypothetical protein P8M30_07110 [Planctomycetaceae bacterium]|nr:hypothetical protein [bacterium]MDG2389073.1 hypothetical protein [Planctomycetaceae bacterium]